MITKNTVSKKIIFKNNFSTICIVAATKSADVKGAQLMQSIRKNSKQDVKFVGIGGQHMKEAGLKKNYGTIDYFFEKPFMPFKNFLRFHVERSYHPAMAPLRFQNKKVLNELQNNNFYVDMVKTEKPDAFVTLGNEMFMKQLYYRLNDAYHQYETIKPPSFFYDKLHINQRNEFGIYYDHFLYSVPFTPVNWKYFEFPSTSVGKEGVYRAYKFLYQQSNKFKNLQSENSIMLSEEWNKEIMESLINEQRTKFRQQHKIDESSTVFYCAPGNNPKEINYSIPLLIKTIENFMQRDQIKNISADNFTVVVSTTQDMLNITKAAVNKQKWPCRLILTDSEEGKFSAMAGSDMGMAINGDIVTECAAMQLPVIVLNFVNIFQAYVTSLYNSFNSDLNFAINGEAYPELWCCIFGSAFPQKLSDHWEKWFVNTKIKYQYVDRYDKILLQMVPKVQNQLSENQTQGQTKEVTVDNYNFSERYSSDFLASMKVIKAAEKYQNLEKDVKNFQIKEKRKEIQKHLGWAQTF